MPSFERISSKKELKYAWSAALKDPKSALYCLLFGIGPGMTLKEFKTAKQFKPVNIVEEKMVRYSDSWQHIPTIELLCMLKRPKTIVELGCRTGATAIPMLYEARKYGGHVYSVDLETWPELDEIKNNKSLKDFWTFIQADDLKLEWNKPIDFLHIDTLHTYDQVYKELQKYEQYVVHGGIITFHDIYLDVVSRAISDYFKDRKDIQYLRYFNNSGLMIVIKE